MTGGCYQFVCCNGEFRILFFSLFGINLGHSRQGLATVLQLQLFSFLINKTSESSGNNEGRQRVKQSNHAARGLRPGPAPEWGPRPLLPHPPQPAKTRPGARGPAGGGGAGASAESAGAVAVVAPARGRAAARGQDPGGQRRRRGHPRVCGRAAESRAPRPAGRWGCGTGCPTSRR